MMMLRYGDYTVGKLYKIGNARSCSLRRGRLPEGEKRYTHLNGKLYNKGNLLLLIEKRRFKKHLFSSERTTTITYLGFLDGDGEFVGELLTDTELAYWFVRAR